MAEAVSLAHTATPPGIEHDPVCGMTVDPATAKHRAEHAGHSYFFCSARCRERFTTEPARYLTPSAVAPEPAAGISGSSAMPQIGQEPGASRTICGCIGQVHSPSSAAVGGTTSAEVR